MSDTHFTNDSERREDFEFAWRIAFGDRAQRLDMKALELFSAAGVSKAKIAGAQMDIHTASVNFLKEQFPEFSAEIDQRLRKERN